MLKQSRHCLRGSKCFQRSWTHQTDLLPNLSESPQTFTMASGWPGVFQALGLLGQNIMLLCHYAEQKRIMDNRLAIFIFFLFCLVSPSAICFYTVHKLYAHALSLLLRFWWISSATYWPRIWTTAWWVVFNGSVWMQIFLKQCQGRQRKKRSFWYVCTLPQSTVV